MKTLILFFCLLGAVVSLRAQDELAELKLLVERAKRGNNADSLAQAYCSMGEYYVYRSSDTARYWFEKSLEKLKTKRPPIYPGLLISLAETYFAKGEVDEALKRYSLARDESVRLKDTLSLINCFSSLGVIYRRKDMPDSTLLCYNRALELLENREEWDLKAQLLANMCIFYSASYRLEESVLYGKRAVEAAAKSGDIDMIIYANYSCGSTLFLLKRYDEGLALIRSVIGEGKKQGKPKFMLKGIVTLLQMFYQMNERDSVNHYMREAEKILPLMSETSVEVLGYREMQFVLLGQMGRYKESLEIQKNLLKYQGINTVLPINKLHLEMARNYYDMKDYVHAYEYYERAFNLSDSLYTEQVNKELSDLTAKYETKEKELEIVRLNQINLEQEARTMRWTIATLVFAFALVILFLYYTFRRKRMQKEQEFRLAQRYIEGLEKERTRLAKELHDGVCNDLLGIGMQVQCLQPTDEAKKELLGLLEQVRGDVRFISHELMPPKFQQVTLAEAAQAYVEQLATPTSVRLSFSQDTEEMDWKQVPEQVAYEVYRILQEVLSNVVKHAGATEIGIHLSLESKNLTLEVTDNGKEYSNDGMPGNGIGLTTIQERVIALEGIVTAEYKEGKHIFKLETPLKK